MDKKWTLPLPLRDAFNKALDLLLEMEPLREWIVLVDAAAVSGSFVIVLLLMLGRDQNFLFQRNNLL